VQYFLNHEDTKPFRSNQVVSSLNIDLAGT
jgi:hypothetical protein